VTWHPSASLKTLRLRAELLAGLRTFFAARQILEVETPLLASSGITDPAIEPFIVTDGDSVSAPRYLQTSPEYAMKRLLVAYGEPVYQIAKAFRDGEAGARHNPEFSLLEWYRPGFDHHQLMDEVAELLAQCLGPRPVSRISYRELFVSNLGVDPMSASADELSALVRSKLDAGSMQGDRDLWLDLLMSHVLEPVLAGEGACFVYDYPASQAALSRIVEHDGAWVGQRFELYVDGIELANGYCELRDVQEQRLRFEQDNERRVSCGKDPRPLDENLLAALQHGLPYCSGVALGIDRLVMLAAGKSDIREVLAFDWSRS
jgi:lysyl-tRNA synthetase class 2